MSISPRERQILSAIEHELRAEDPALVAALAEAREPVRRRFPLPAGHLLLLILALLALITVGPLVLHLGVVALAILTAALIVPWVVSASRAAERRYLCLTKAPRPDAAAARRPRSTGS